MWVYNTTVLCVCVCVCVCACARADRQYRVRTPVEKCFRPPPSPHNPPIKGEPAKNLYTESDRLTLS
jgi:hypothetical protein